MSREIFPRRPEAEAMFASASSSFPPTTAAARCTWLLSSQRASTPPGRPVCMSWESPSKRPKNGSRVDVVFISATRIITCWSWPRPVSGPFTELLRQTFAQRPRDQDVGHDREHNDGKCAAVIRVDRKLRHSRKELREREFPTPARLSKDECAGKNDRQDGFSGDEPGSQQRATLFVLLRAGWRKFSRSSDAVGDELEHPADENRRGGFKRQVHAHGDQ